MISAFQIRFARDTIRCHTPREYAQTKFYITRDASVFGIVFSFFFFFIRLCALTRQPCFTWFFFSQPPPPLVLNYLTQVICNKAVGAELVSAALRRETTRRKRIVFLYPLPNVSYGTFLSRHIVIFFSCALCFRKKFKSRRFEFPPISFERTEIRMKFLYVLIITTHLAKLARAWEICENLNLRFFFVNIVKGISLKLFWRKFERLRSPF